MHTTFGASISLCHSGTLNRFYLFFVHCDADDCGGGDGDREEL